MSWDVLSSKCGDFRMFLNIAFSEKKTRFPNDVLPDVLSDCPSLYTPDMSSLMIRDRSSCI